MKLPQHQFLLPILDGDISDVYQADGYYIRKATNLSLHTPIKGRKASFIISLRSENNKDLRLEVNGEAKVMTVYADYSFVYINSAETANLRSDDAFYARLIICYLPPLIISGVELMEKLLGLGRFRMLTPAPHESDLISKDFYDLTSPEHRIIPIGLRDNEAIPTITKPLRQEDAVSPVPQVIELESTGFCNLKCVHCPQGIDGGMPYPPKQISGQVIENLGGFLKNAKTLMLHGYGEPLASPQTWKILDSLENTQTFCHFNTNGILLNKKT